MNAMGPGEATFVKCDVSKEDEIKVFLLIPCEVNEKWKNITCCT